MSVIVIGAGPSGLAAATELKRRGMDQVTVLDREAEAGGVPRHCGHYPFGWREFRRVMKGPDYATRLRDTALAAGVDIRTGTTVVALKPGPSVTVTGDQGVRDLTADRVVLATGTRETPRSARFVGGTRPRGVMNTGALQAMVYLKGQRPFRRPVIVGTELVSFSAILTCRHLAIRPVAMIESGRRPTAFRAATGLPRLFGIPVHLGTQIETIHGDGQVEGVTLRHGDGSAYRIDTDGVVFTGQFMPEAALIRASHLVLDGTTGGPAFDAFGRCSDPAYFAVGNLLRPVETAGWCWQEGKTVARHVAHSLAGKLSDAGVPVRVVHDALRYAVPQSLSPEARDGALQLRVRRPVSGVLQAWQGETLLTEWSVSTRPERRILIPRGDLGTLDPETPVSITVMEAE